MLTTLSSAAQQAASADANSGVEIAAAMLALPELLVIFGAIVLLFGATKLPQLGKGLGEAIGNFKKASKDAMEEPRDEVDGTPKLRDNKVDGDFEGPAA